MSKQWINVSDPNMMKQQQKWLPPMAGILMEENLLEKRSRRQMTGTTAKLKY